MKLITKFKKGAEIDPEQMQMVRNSILKTDPSAKISFGLKYGIWAECLGPKQWEFDPDNTFEGTVMGKPALIFMWLPYFID